MGNKQNHGGVPGASLPVDRSVSIKGSKRKAPKKLAIVLGAADYSQSTSDEFYD